MRPCFFAVTFVITTILITHKGACRQAERAALDAVEQFHGVRLLGNAVIGDTSYSEWEFDATYKGAGRIKLTQVAARRWKDGLIVHERFYYQKG